MKEPEVRHIALHGRINGKPIHGKVEETHISWVILTREFAFKIKKPLKLDFLDFSTLALRKELCQREVKLNSRFSDIYLDVSPIRFIDGQWYIGGSDDSFTVDYCVVMKRMAISKRMDNALQKGKVTERSIKTLASEVASVHNRAEQIFIPFDIGVAKQTFNDIGSLREFASTEIDKQFDTIIGSAIDWSESFLEKHSGRIQQRIDHGLKRDVHGDLHCGNIFLYRKPVLFDCIEFNDEFRQIDVLYELAFLCMDLERYRHERLADVFVSEYVKYFAAIRQKEDYALLVYFKSLRANIRAKVHLMQCNQAESHAELTQHFDEARKYLSLLNQYRTSSLI